MEPTPPDQSPNAATPVIDLGAVFWKQIQDAAQQSGWMPPGYMMNDWVSDVCHFLRTGDSSSVPIEEEQLQAAIAFLSSASFVQCAEADPREQVATLIGALVRERIKNRILQRTLSAIHDVAHCAAKAGPLHTPTLSDAWPKFNRLATMAVHGAHLAERAATTKTDPAVEELRNALVRLRAAIAAYDNHSTSTNGFEGAVGLPASEKALRFNEPYVELLESALVADRVLERRP